MKDKCNYLSKAIGIAGNLGSGKTTLATVLCARLDACHVSFGSFVRAEAKARGLEDRRSVLQELGSQLIADLGAREFVLRTAQIGSSSSSGTVVFDGIRHISVWEAVCELFDSTFLVYLEESDSTIVDRVLKRDQVSRESIEKAKEHSMEKGVVELRLSADAIIRGLPVDETVDRLISLLPNSFI